MTAMQTTGPYIINSHTYVTLNIFVLNLKIYGEVKTSNVISNKYHVPRSLSNGYYAQKAKISTNRKGNMKWHNC
jgi:hypothetical protein